MPKNCGLTNCIVCGIEFEKRSANNVFCKKCYPDYLKKKVKEYQKKQPYQDYVKKYRAKPEYKVRHRNYQNTESYKKYAREYSQTPESRERQRIGRQSEKRKEYMRNYMNALYRSKLKFDPKFHERKRRYAEKNKERIKEKRRLWELRPEVIIRKKEYWERWKNSEKGKAILDRRNHDKNRYEKNKLFWKTEKGKALRISDNYRRRKGSGKVTLELINAVLRKTDNCCTYCTVPLTEKTRHIDHFEPLLPREGYPRGDNSFENLWPSCRSCNQHKNNKSGVEFLKQINVKK